MVITLITKEKILTTPLPEKVSGRYWICDRTAQGNNWRVADVEAQHGQWVLHGSNELRLFDDAGIEVPYIRIDDAVQIVNAKYQKDSSKVQILVEPTTEDRHTYTKYVVHDACSLTIGRTDSNLIRFNNNFVSSHHADLVWNGTEWSIFDHQSKNGIFVNGQRIENARVVPGDLIFIMGMKIILGCNFFAVNNPDGEVTVSSDVVNILETQTGLMCPSVEKITEPQENFSRAPKIKHSITKQEIRVDAPPQRQKKEETPLALLLGPALTMGMTAVVMGATAVINLTNGTSTISASLPTIIMAFSMLCGTLLWPFVTKENERKKAEKAELKRQTKYREYLGDIRSNIFSLSKEQRKIMLENYPSNAECVEFLHGRELWRRIAGQNDFLQLRLGLGDVPLQADIKFPDKHFSLEEDPLINEVLRLSDEPKIINDAPVVCSLLTHPVIGLAGSKSKTDILLKTLLLQLVILHGYDEVKIAFITSESRVNSWGFVKWFPHVWSTDKDLRFFAGNPDEINALWSELEKVLIARKENQTSYKHQPLPYYIIIAEDIKQAENIGIFKQIGTDFPDLGFSCIAIGGQVSDLPKECSMVVDIKEKVSFLYDKNSTFGERTQFDVEESNFVDMEEVAGILANITLDIANENFTLPSMLTFLEMYNVGKAEHLNALTRWKENSPVNTLQAPIGVGNDGTPIYLDLHEKSQGPHGLVAGMTGSGKSEFIITYILSMAVNYHPDEVSFILIDYKGGGLAGAFEDAGSGIRLPHLAGTITNLDGTEVNRALISIQSELRRRQAIFNAAKQISGEGTIDIYKYQKMYRSGSVFEPVPHLFIISDEFAELKAQQPEFMAQLISTARIGRSLGVHLILATQKPSGVVDDQIWSNSRFHICLKVQERADSMEMLKRPDAAELKETGRFYLQVGFDELFATGQSAWCGAPYYPSDEVERKHDDGIEVIDRLGRTLIEAKPKVENRVSNSSQIVSIVRYLSQLADEDGIRARNLWLPTLSDKIYLSDLEHKYAWKADKVKLAPIIGEFDDPSNQKQGILTLPLTEKGNVLLYGATGSGKTMFLDAVLVGLLQNYTTEQLNVYIIDLGEETLKTFINAPQVGDVLFSADDEKIVNLFKLLQKEIEHRKKIFAEGEGNYISDYGRVSEPLPQIVVILRNYSAFAEQFEMLDDKLIQITRDCNKYGIYFIVTANAASSIRYRIAQNFATVLSLQLNDTSDYIGLFGGTGGVYPSKYQGRGIYKTDKVYEFQTAYYEKNASQNSLREFAEALKQICPEKAKTIPVLPHSVTVDYFPETFTASAVPIGVEKSDLRICTCNLEDTVITPFLTQNPEEMLHVLRGVCEQLLRLTGDLTIIDGAKLLQGERFRECGAGYPIAEAVNQLFDEVVYRNNTYKNQESPNKALFARKYYVLTGIQQIFSELDAQGRDKLVTLLEKSELAYNIRFILCGTAKELNAYTTNAWYKRHVSGYDGIWVGDGICEQYLLKIGKISGNLYTELPSGFGYIIKRGKPVLTKMIVGSEEGQEYDK